MEFAKPSEVVQPKGGDFFMHEPDERDYVLGANDPKKLGEVLMESGDWTTYDTLWELQRNSWGWDNYSCVSYSNNKVKQFIIKKKYSLDVNMSDRFLSVGSGTQPGRGNSIKGVAEWARTHGWVEEEKYPFTPNMGQDEFFAPIPADIYDAALKKLVPKGGIWEFGYLSVTGNTPYSLLPALQVSPVQVAVETPYVFNSQGEIINAGNSYNHAVVLANKDGAVRDSETQQWLKFSPNYAFLSPYIHTVKKKTMKMYRKQGQAAIGFINSEDGGIYLWADGVIPGGSLFKTMGYTYDMAEVVDEWPAPIKGYITTTGLISNF